MQVALDRARRRLKRGQQLIDDLTVQMRDAAGELKFELAGRLRDEIADLKRELRGIKDTGN